jgi:hypothetical protein
MTERTLIHGQDGAILDDIRDHRYAIFQTRVERIPRLIKGLPARSRTAAPSPRLSQRSPSRSRGGDDVFGLYLVKTGRRPAVHRGLRRAPVRGQPRPVLHVDGASGRTVSARSTCPAST